MAAVGRWWPVVVGVGAALDAGRSAAALGRVASFVESQAASPALVEVGAVEASSSSDWGLFAKQRVRKGETVLEVGSCVTGASVRAEHGLESLEPLCGDVSLIAYGLLRGEWPDSYFPDDLSAFPALLEDAGTWCSSRDFGVLRENALDDYAALGVSDASENDFLRAVCLALSRSFAVDGELVFAPGIDFVNHDDMLDPELAPVSWKKQLFGKASTVRLVASEDVEAGAELRASYGPLGAAEYLETYGFVPTRGAARRLAAVSELRFELGDGYEFVDDKRLVLERAGYDEDDLSIDLGVGGEVDPELLRFLRLRHLAGPDAFLLEPVFQAEIWDDFLSLPVSRPNELAVLEAIKAECAAVKLALEAPNPSPSPGLDAVRRLELEALRATIDWCDAELGSLDGKEYYQERRLKDLGLDTEWCADDAQWSGSRAPGSVDW